MTSIRASFQKPPTVSDDYRAIEIYRLSARIIYEKGFDATSMGDIAEAVDLTKGGLYYYIKGKKELLYAIMNYAMDRLETEVLAAARSETDPHRRLANLVSGHVQLVIDEPSAMSILVTEDEGLNESHRPKIQKRKRAYTDFLRDSIADVLRTQPPHVRIDPTVAAFGLLGMMQWVVRWYRPEGRFAKEEVVEQITQLALHGLIPEAAEATRH